jgi:hypothetical protein
MTSDNSGSDPDRSVVKKTMPTVIRADGAPDGLADTHENMRTSEERSTAPMPTTPPNNNAQAPRPMTVPRSSRGALGSTLRMELTVHKCEGNEPPRITVRPNQPEPEPKSSPEMGDGYTTLPEMPRRPRKPTTPGFAPAFKDPSARPLAHSSVAYNEYEAQAPLENTMKRGSDVDPDVRQVSVPPGVNRPRRPRRPGERTLIMKPHSRRSSKKRDWVFVVLLVAALGLTASMFLSQQAPSEEIVDAAAYDDPEAQEDSQEAFEHTTLRPWKDENAAAAAAQTDTKAITAREPAVAESGAVQATELRSMPAGAEVIAGNAVVGSTPVRVARGSADLEYVLRLPGHESKVVRVGPHSPPSILVELGPVRPAAPSGTP